MERVTRTRGCTNSFVYLKLLLPTLIVTPDPTMDMSLRRPTGSVKHTRFTLPVVENSWCPCFHPSSEFEFLHRTGVGILSVVSSM